MKHAWVHSTQDRKRSAALLAVCLGFVLLLLVLALPAVAGAEVDVIDTCLDPCHVSPGIIGPDVQTAYFGAGENAGHSMDWNPRVVADSSGTVLPQGSRMPCDECHITHGETTTSIYMFDSTRVGSPVTTVRQLCEGCHIPYDSAAGPAVVAGLVLNKLPPAPVDHGDSSNRDCFDCHGGGGHGPGSHSNGESCGDPACHGGTGAHAIHLSESDPRGPGEIHCYDCHETGDAPYFANGTDDDLSGDIDLDEATDCDACHSPGGSYNGVDSTLTASGTMSVGAKDNWDSGVYETTATLKAGTEKWCAGCHDGDEDTPGEEPSLIDGVYAPPVVGDESGSYTYGTGYGYYKTGHGVPSSTVLPANGYDTGPGIECDACHDFTQGHIDGDRRTFTNAGTPTDYRQSYRLSLVDGQNPLLVPRPSANATDNFLLCGQSECHDPYPFLYQTETTSTPSTRRTNFWWESGGANGSRYNQHKSHMSFGNITWAPDWGSTRTSRTQCVTCHNVHGSTQLAMIHDGSLISDTVTRTPGMLVYYYNDDISTYGPFAAPVPADVTLAMSDALLWSAGSTNRLCSTCHGGGFIRVARQLWKDYGLQPTLDWTGETYYEADGSHPDTTTVEGTFFFRVEYTDRNNDAPSFVTLRIDRNDDGDCEDTSETVAMTKEALLDQTYYDGMIYKTSLSLAKAGDNEIAYHFEASDGVFPTSMSETRTVTVSNAAPELSWTGDTGYADDGVFPNGGTTGVTDYEFRIAYKDPDGEAPTGGAPLLWVDADDDGQFESGESATMTAMSGGDYTSGKRYTHTTKLTRQSDDTLLYRFTASDGFDSAASATKTVGVLQNINQAPALSWTGETGYEADGIDPQSQAGGKPFDFRVEYSDANNHAPLDGRVWIDLDDNGAYEASEKYTMDDSVNADDPTKTDGDYSNGEIFAEKVYVPFDGDGTLTYCFSFSDEASATGDPMDDGNPADDETFVVLDALRVPSEYGTIQAAIDTATAGQIVLVADGTYAENISFGGKDITVETVNGAGSTSIEDTGTLVTFDPGSNSTLRGFTISNGTTGVYSSDSDVTIRDCVIGNMSGAGILHVGEAGDLLLVEDTTISNNHPGVESTSPASFATFRRTDVTGNSVAGDGAGINMAGSGIRANGRWTLEECTFSDNVAGGSGGALYNSGATFEVAISDCIFENNRANGGGGGAIAGYGTANEAGTVNRTIFRGNYASGDGGAVRLQGPSSPFSLWTYTNCIFSGNYAGGDGGAYYRLSISIGTVFNHCTFSGNSADRGGGIFIENSFFNRIKVNNSIMYGDDARSSTTRNEWDTGNETFYRYPGITYTDIYQDIHGFVYTEANFAADPMFVNPVAASNAPTSAGDYHLQIGSPCEGAADPASTIAEDIDNEMRPQGSANRDSGADEIDVVAAAMASGKSFIVSLPRTGPVGEQSTRVTSAQTSGPTSLEATPADSRQPDALLGTLQTAASGVDLPRDAGAPLESAVAPRKPAGETPTRPTTIPAAMGFASIAGLALRKILAAI